MVDNNNYFGKNLKIVRKNILDVTQEELAEALELESVNSISEWENGKKLPRNIEDILERLFKAFPLLSQMGMTIEMFLSEDISPLLECFFNEELRKKLQKKMYPIFETKESLKNPYFANAYKAHENSEYEEYEKIRENYLKSLNDENCKEPALANLMALDLSYYHSAFNFGKNLSNSILDEEKDINKNDDLKQYLLIQPYEQKLETDEEYCKQEKEILIKVKEDLKKLKNGNDQDLAYYYLALLLILGTSTDNEVRSASVELGTVVMEKFAAFGNKYANDLIDAMESIMG